MSTYGSRRMLSLLGLAAITTFATGCASLSPITTQHVIDAQHTWGKGVVKIGKAYTAGEDYKKVATTHVDTLYAYDHGEVLFKPTKAADQQFRLDRNGAISYFVGHNSAYPEDKGFALQPWTNVRFDNAGIYIHNDYAVAMGNYFFKTTSGEEVKVEYTFGYIRDKHGDLRINLHHSSLPYVKH